MQFIINAFMCFNQGYRLYTTLVLISCIINHCVMSILLKRERKIVCSLNRILFNIFQLSFLFLLYTQEYWEASNYILDVFTEFIQRETWYSFNKWFRDSKPYLEDCRKYLNATVFQFFCSHIISYYRSNIKL